MAKFVNPTKVITGPDTRLSYCNAWEPKAINGGTPKYSVSLIIPKSDTKTIEKVRAAIQAAYEEGTSKLKGNGKSVPALTALKTPLRDGDLERPDDEAYANSYFMLILIHHTLIFYCLHILWTDSLFRWLIRQAVRKYPHLFFQHLLMRKLQKERLT